MSASRNAAIEKPRRIVIPDEYVRTGRSIAFSSSAKATISSKRSRISARRSPWIAPFRKTFSRPVKSGMEACAELEQRADPALSRDATRGGFDDAGDEAEERGLPRAVPSDEPDRFPGATSIETSRSAQTSVASRPAALDEEILQRPGLAGVDAEASRHRFDADLAHSHQDLD